MGEKQEHLARGPDIKEENGQQGKERQHGELSGQKKIKTKRPNIQKVKKQFKKEIRD